MRTLVLKVGTNVITQENGLLDRGVLASLVEQIHAAHEAGHAVILVSSGAMGAGRGIIQLSDKCDDVVRRQVLASVGQIPLMQNYLELFAERGKNCAQVLATKEDFRDREHYLNMKNCFEALLANGATPIVNENDVVSVDELMFTDNDELAGMIASMMNAERLVLLTSVDGIFTGDPADTKSQLIHSVQPGDSLQGHIQSGTSSFGRGGMLTKARMAGKLAKMGMHVHIANGRSPKILEKILAAEAVGTHFIAEPQSPSARKRRIAHSRGYEKGIVTINDCAVEVLHEKIASLLPIGVSGVEGEFEKGEVLRIQNERGETLGYGIAAYGHKSARANMGKKQKKALIHYDYLFLES